MTSAVQKFINFSKTGRPFRTRGGIKSWRIIFSNLLFLTSGFRLLTSDFRLLILMKYFLIGFMGTGKSYWGKQWAEAHNLSFFDLDEEIEKLEGKTVSQIFDSKGEAYFRKKEKEILRSFFKKDKTFYVIGNIGQNNLDFCSFESNGSQK